MLDADQYDLRCVHDRTTADRDDQVRLGLPRLSGGLHDDLTRGMFGYPIERAGISIPQGYPDFLDFFGLGVQRPTHDQEYAPDIEAFGLLT